MDALKRRRGVEKRNITIATTWLNSVDKDLVTVIQLKNRRSVIEGYFQKFEEYQGNIEDACADDAELAIQVGERDDFETKYLDLISKLDTIIDEKTPTQATAASCSHSASSHHKVNLPRMDLPIFHGNYEDWIEFRDLFVASIDSNASLSNGQRLQYLKSSLKGEAAGLIKTLSISDANYDEAWKILTERYDNKREIIHSLLKRLFNQHHLTNESVTGLKQLLDTTKECLGTLAVLARPVEHWDDVIVYFVVERMDPETRKQWAFRPEETDMPKLSDLYTFMEQRIRALKASIVSDSNEKHVNLPNPRRRATSNFSSFNKCLLCKGDHFLFKCKTFSTMNISDRYELVKKHNMCYNCLRTDHRINDCKSQSKCRTCQRKHHSLLHKERQGTPMTTHEGVPPSNQESGATRSANPTFSGYGGGASTNVLLATAIVSVRDNEGNSHPVRVLLDTGSEASFISEKCVTSLSLQRRRSEVVVTGISSSSGGVTKGEVDVKLQSCINNESIHVTCLVLPKVTSNIPSELCAKSRWPHVQGLQLADPDFNIPGNIDILLGAEYVPLIMCEGRSFGPPNTPIAENTIFGWVLLGRVSVNSHLTVRSHHVQCTVDELLMKFWEIEELPESRQLTPDEHQAEEHFRSTHYRSEDGRYVVKLPFNVNKERLGSSRDAAIRRWKQVERRLQANPDLNTKYCKFMIEYISLNHMELIPESESVEIIGKTFYLPHHFVHKIGTAENKFRVVFDGSFKTSTNISLNDCLIVGPTIQPDIFTLLLKFRLHQVVLKTDIGKMYRQFWVDITDQDYQRIVWRANPDEPIRDYRLKTITYGTASAPFLATRCLKQAAVQNKDDYPTASKVLDEDTYVDDVITGTSTTELAKQLARELQTIASSAGLSMLKWSSNNEDVLSSISPEQREVDSTLSFDDSPTLKALGVQWHPQTDSFSFSFTDIPLGPDAKVTKKILLSEIAKVFDPLGFLSPVIIREKILLQELWKAELQWNDDLPDQIRQQWQQYYYERKDISSIIIPRCIMPPPPYKNQELHGFSDASLRAYGAVVYLRTELHDGSYHVYMITSKTRVAPIKQSSLPRLELMGAVMVAQLLTTVKKTLGLDVDICAWSDATIVLKWIAGFPSRWGTFVGNRVSQIQQLIPCENWRHVAGDQNPADCASRGISPSELLQHPSWWHGPSWLQSSQLPFFQTPPLSPDVDLEERKKPVLVHAATLGKSSFKLNLYKKYSRLSKLTRITAMILRFIKNYFLKKDDQVRGFITPKELDDSLVFWMKFAQSQSFAEEKRELQQTKTVKQSSKLHQLTPFIDQQGLIRVLGRLSHSASIPETQKHPIILPSNEHLTKLIIEHCHLHHLHSGFQLTWATLRRDYWILRARDTIRHLIRKCVTCRRHRAETAKQLMGNLPDARVNPCRTFENVGVDYAGPFNLRVLKGRSNKLMKGYMAVFVCMASKAVHLEAVSDLSTDAFLAAFERFVSRRGLCHRIFSDCGTNFIGASKELKTLFSSQQHNSEVADKLANRGIVWSFNPPAAPHQGGVWEAAVKSAKFHMKRVIGDESLTFEQFHTILCKVEACLNSRPLTPMSPSPDDMEVLTPGHFLIGQALNAVPQQPLHDVKVNRLDKWQRAQQLTQHFWRRWSNEYLSTLQQRFKWSTQNRNLQVDDVVLVKEDNTPPMHWRTGRIIQTFPGKDQIVRVVKVKLFLINFMNWNVLSQRYVHYYIMMNDNFSNSVIIFAILRCCILLQCVCGCSPSSQIALVSRIAVMGMP